jgi:competence protein ComEC
MKKACLCLLAGLYAPQLSSFASHSDLILLLAFAIIAGIVTGKLTALLVVAAGYVVFVVSASQVIDTRIATEFEGDSLMVVVHIVDFPQTRGETVSFVAEVDENPWVPRRVRVSWFGPDEQIGLGDVWRLELRLKRPRGTSNPGVFDHETWLFRNRIAATGYVVDSSRNQLLRAADLGSIDALRVHIVERLQRVLVEPERAAVLAAVSVGARHLVTREQWQRYARSGTSHLMAISGLHVGMVAAAGYMMTAVFSGLLRLPVNHHFVSTAIALACACGYACISGLAVPAQRSVTMIALSAVAILRYRMVRPVPVIATACVALSLMSPLATLEPGFKLSFTAVLVLVWIAQRSTPDAGLTGKPVHSLRLLAAVQIALLFGLIPLTVLLFGRIALLAPAVNLAAVPVFSLATIPLTLCGLMLDGPLAPLGDHVLRLASSSLGLVERMVGMAAALPVSSVQVPQLSRAYLVVLFIALAWVILPQGWPGRSISWVALLAIALYEPSRPVPGCMRLHVLDVGQGLAIVISTQTSTLLFDTGPAFRSGGSAAESVVLPFLAAHNIDRIDQLVVSHADLDHAGGISAIRRTLPIGHVFAGEDPDAPMRIRPCRRGARWEADGINFEFLHPVTGSRSEGNDASCVLQVAAGERRVLLTGDIESPAEDELRRSALLRPVDVVVVPHHGSSTSSGAAFVASLRPTVAVISAGFGNRWGLPDKTVESRWRAAGAEILNTAHDGAISIRICDRTGITSLSRHRELRRRLWHE